MWYVQAVTTNKGIVPHRDQKEEIAESHLMWYVQRMSSTADLDPVLQGAARGRDRGGGGHLHVLLLHIQACILAVAHDGPLHLLDLHVPDHPTIKPHHFVTDWSHGQLTMTVMCSCFLHVWNSYNQLKRYKNKYTVAISSLHEQFYTSMNSKERAYSSMKTATCWATKNKQIKTKRYRTKTNQASSYSNQCLTVNFLGCTKQFQDTHHLALYTWLPAGSIVVHAEGKVTSSCGLSLIGFSSLWAEQHHSNQQH